MYILTIQTKLCSHAVFFVKFNNDKTIVDSGTTDVFFPTEVFHEVKNTFASFFKVS